MAQERNKKAGDAVDSESSKQPQPGKGTPKTPKSLKPEPKIVKKSNLSNGGNQQKASADKNKGKKDTENNKMQVKDQRDSSQKEGMIFMCNSKTKSDCFRYMVMGLPANKKDIVVSVKPGMKLFLYDFENKVLHGIYKAASSGAMKLEPAAFGGSYPAQVRFKVHMDCLPLSERAFREAVLGNFDRDKIKFKTQLTAQEVSKLTSLFQASPVPKSYVNTTGQSSQAVHVPLIPLIPIMPSEVEAPLHPQQAEILLGGPAQREDASLDIPSFTEKEYRMYGLRRLARPARSEPSHGNRHHYDSSDRHANSSYPNKMDVDPDNHLQRRSESEYRKPPENHPANLPHLASYAYGALRSEPGYRVQGAEVGSLHTAHAANALSEYNMSRQQTHDTGFVPVSSRYAFGEPSSFSYY